MEIREIIINKSYGFKEYQEAVKKHPDFDINELDQSDCSLLQLAISYNKWDIAKDLIKRGINLDNQDKNGSTALHYLCVGNTNPEILENVLKAGANPDIRNKEKMTPLFLVRRICYADSEEKYRLMRMFLDYGADKNIHCIQANTAEEEAEKRGDQRAVAIFKEYEGGKRREEYPSDPEELYDFVDPIFDEGRYLDVIDVVTSFSEDKMIQKLVNILAASYNNVRAYRKALALIEKYKYLYEDEMYLWYYYAAYAYEDLEEYKNTLDCIEAGVAECNRLKKEGILSGEEYEKRVNNLVYLKKFCPKFLGGLERRTYPKVDDKLFKILKKYYDKKNKKPSPDLLPEKDKDYLVSSGYPFEGVIEYTHNECINACKEILKHPNLTIDNLIAAYVCGFSSFPRGRQPILSYLFAKAVPVHDLTDPYGDKGHCSICAIPGIRNISLGERIYREYLGYSWNEMWEDDIAGLQEFADLEPCTPTKEDIRIFNDVIEMIRNAPTKETPGKLETRIKQSKIVPWYEKYKFRGMLITLAELGVMPNPYIKPLYDGFTPFMEQCSISDHVPGGPRSEIGLPLSGWRGDNPIDEERLKMFFGKYLS